MAALHADLESNWLMVRDRDLRLQWVPPP